MASTMWPAAHSAGRAAAAGFGYTDVVTVGRTVAGNGIPSGFVGVSLEYRTVFGFEHGGTGGADLVLAHLIRNLAPGQTPVVRIGGDSTDWTWWPVRGVPRPAGVVYSLSPAWVAHARALAVSTGARLILGINLEAGSSTIAGAEARRLVAGLGRRRIEALEIGNEPELYSLLPWYHTRGGIPRFGRPLSYSVTDYGREFARFAAVLPHVALAGPSTGSTSWLAGLGGLIAANPGLRLATFHVYALNPAGDAYRGHDCSTPSGDPAHPTVPALLTPSASDGLTREVSPFVALAHGHGVPLRVDEMNAVTCGGTPRVSNTSASALWVLSALFALARAGVDGVNIHTWRGSDGKLFDIRRGRHGWVATVRPEYYGMLMFARAAPPGSRLLNAQVSRAGAVQAWALRAPDRSVRVVLTNDSVTHVRWVQVRLALGRRPAELERLDTRGAYATGGVTLAGQTFGERTTTGVPTGRVHVGLVKPADGGYTVRLPPASAALLTVT